MNFEKVEITGLDSFAKCIGKLDSAAPTEIFYGNQVNPQKAEAYTGVYNLNKGKLSTIASAGYQIIQHNDVVQAVTETLGRLNMNVIGRLNNYGDRIVADLVFGSENGVITDDADGIQIGIRVVNSYNKSTSFRLEMFGFRRICQNGMTFGAKSFGIVETTIHYGSKEKNMQAISKITESFIAKVINSSTEMQKYVNEMICDSLEYDMAVRIIKSMIGKKHYSEILSRLEQCTSRWDMYNALTNYATHGQQLTPNVQQHMEKLSRKVMETSTSKLTAETLKHEAEITASV
jgi:hypothetical protein